MQLGITIPLLRHLKLKPLSYGPPADLHFCWDLHILTPNSRPSLFAVHSSSRFAFLLYDVSHADWQDLTALFLTGLRQSMAQENFSQTQINAYLKQSGTPIVTKTHGRRPVAFLNRATDDFYALPVTLDPVQPYQPQVTQFLNDIPCRCAGHKGTHIARIFFNQDISSIF